MNKKILRIDASMRKNGSYSRKLTDVLIEKLSKEERYTIHKRDLANGVNFINEEWINANFTAHKERTTQQRDILSNSDELVCELQNADVVVIGLPIYNFGTPAAFKAWIDLVARSQVTFQYTDKGPVGLLKNKKAYVIITSGGTQLHSVIDFVSQYTKHVLGFIGIHDVTLINGSGISLNEEKVLASAKLEIAAI